MSARVDANIYATSFKYDVFGREIERFNALGDTWTFAYDPRHSIVQTVDAVGQTINKTFDELNRMTGIELVEADGSVGRACVLAGAGQSHRPRL